MRMSAKQSVCLSVRAAGSLYVVDRRTAICRPIKAQDKIGYILFQLMPTDRHIDKDRHIR